MSAARFDETEASMEVHEAIVPNPLETNEFVIGLLMLANLVAVIVGLFLALRWALTRCVRWLRRR
ncbi:hypothetical protein [Xanthobacter agilis]|uniref:hypothetical protein n=1 Tax=Xanthobacter agilis TaxID=47492 RepID=UPI00372AAD35